MAVSLKKGQGVTLAKEKFYDQVFLGLGWDPVPQKGLAWWLGVPAGQIDLDASCIMLDAAGRELDAVWFRQLRSRDLAIAHTGDNLTGVGAGDDERIAVRLNMLPAAVTTLIFTITSWSGQDFGSIANAYCRLVDARSGDEIARYALAGRPGHTALVMARMDRTPAGWRLTAVGEPGHGRSYRDLGRVIAALPRLG